MKKIFGVFILGTLLLACQVNKSTISNQTAVSKKKWSIEQLQLRANQYLDTAQWDQKLLRQDVTTYNKYADQFRDFPLNQSPFPVAKYEYSVFSTPFNIVTDNLVFKGVSLGEYEQTKDSKQIYKLSLLVLTNNINAEESTWVNSRNYPYLTAQGYFKTVKNKFDWVLSASPDGYSTLVFNMKLFDLRFGETILIYPQKDHTFFYQQIQLSPNDYKHFEQYKKAILQNPKVKTQLHSLRN